MHGLQACLFNTLLLLHSTFMLCMMKMSLIGEVGGHALNSHGNYIVDHGKSWKNHGIVFLNFCGNPVYCFCSVSSSSSFSFRPKFYPEEFSVTTGRIVLKFRDMVDMDVKLSTRVSKFKMSNSKTGQRACPKTLKFCQDYISLTT